MALQQAPIPTLWLYGKTGSGKTSIIRFLTGATDAEIGTGYRPCTRRSRVFAFPDDDLPVLKFLDTRGLGEADYDPSEDFSELDEEAQLVMLAVRLNDHALHDIVKPFRKIRKRHPERPVLLVITHLHGAYPGQQHPSPDPFKEPLAASDLQEAENVPANLRRSLVQQFETWEGLFDQWVTIDLTPEDDGFDEPNYGGDRLKQAIVELLPAAYRHTFIELDKLRGCFREVHERKVAQIILSHSIIAASAAAVPLPWIDIPLVLAIQSRLAHRLARYNRHPIDATTIANITTAVGGRVALRMGMRELLKFIPWVGMAANAAASFAFTYASGWMWHWYFLEVSKGHVPSADALREKYQEQLKRAAQIWQTTHTKET